MRLLSRNQVPWTPKSIKIGSTPIRWENKETFERFYDKLKAFGEANGLPVPTELEVEEAICKQIPRAWCSDKPINARTRNIETPKPRRPGCRTCGRR